MLLLSVARDEVEFVELFLTGVLVGGDFAHSRHLLYFARRLDLLAAIVRASHQRVVRVVPRHRDALRAYRVVVVILAVGSSLALLSPQRVNR